MECRGLIILRVLDNGSSLNVCPSMTLSRISIDDSMIHLNIKMVRSFDGTNTSACSKIDLEILIGLCKFDVSFVVVDIPIVFNLLLRQPWICRGILHLVCIR